MELFIILAFGFLLLLSSSGSDTVAPQVIYVSAPEPRGGGGALLGLAIFIALALYLFGGLSP